MKELRYELYIGGTPEQVWAALTSPEYVKQIYYGSTIRSTFREGDLLEYVGPGTDGEETVHVYGTLREFKPLEALRFTHTAGDSNRNGGFPYESRISWLLAPVGGCTRLTLIHDEWHPEDPSYDNSGSAWTEILSNTKTLVETGRTLDFGRQG